MPVRKFSDVVIFSRIIGAALLVCGWLVAGLFFSRWLMNNGYPQFTVPLALVVCTACALLSGWREIRSILKSIRDVEREKDE